MSALLKGDDKINKRTVCNYKHSNDNYVDLFAKIAFCAHILKGKQHVYNLTILTKQQKFVYACSSCLATWYVAIPCSYLDVYNILNF